MKVKKVLKVTVIILLSLVLICLAAAGIFIGTYQATMSFDCSEKTGKVMKGASGYLYGIAERGVPSAEMTESIDITTVAQKTSGGGQHPIGDIDHIDPMLSGTEYEVVYLQDMYDTWYYLNDEIMTQRSAGSYDWQKLLEEDYLPKVKEAVTKMEQRTYQGKIVYCLYNECDNGIWFGESQKDENPDNAYGVWCDYNDNGKDAFNLAWKQTYDLVKSLSPDALIGGPGFCDYDHNEIAYFLSFCKDNQCLPDVMIYHELGERTIYYFDEHIRDYRAMEQELGMEELPIIITEYGMMNENGYPGTMVQYMTQFENNKVYGDNAYWRLADNLNDTCADDNSPNAEWWLMRWYTEMKGETLQGTNKDILSSDFANYFKYHYEELSYNGFMGIASLSEDGKEIDVVCGGGDRKSRVELKNLEATNLYDKTVQITIESTVYKGLYGVVNEPVLIKKYTKKAGNSLTVELGETDKANAYHIVITEADESAAPAYENDAVPQRYEFEDGTLLGAAYTYDSYCPASGCNEAGNDMVGGMENEGDGVEITVDIPEDGYYDLDFVYGNSNDGAFDENGRQNPDDRVDTTVKISVDGEEYITKLANTIKSEYTSCHTLQAVPLKKGEHKIKSEHMEGTCVLDSLVVTKTNDPDAVNTTVAVLKDSDRTNENVQSFLVIAPEDGYYSVTNNANARMMTVDGTEITFNEIGGATVYLKRGLNYLDLICNNEGELTVCQSEESASVTYSAEEAYLAGGAYQDTVGDRSYISGITNLGGSAEYKVQTEKAGTYRITLAYSNNEESGHHDYNVDLIERYVTLWIGNQKQGNYYCRNTYSWQTVKTVTFTVNLPAGESSLWLTNDGSENFNGNPTAAPYLFSVTVSPAQL